MGLRRQGILIIILPYSPLHSNREEADGCEGEGEDEGKYCRTTTHITHTLPEITSHRSMTRPQLINVTLTHPELIFQPLHWLSRCLTLQSTGLEDTIVRGVVDGVEG